MNTIAFCKFHGFGNDYIVIERSALGTRELPQLARYMCHRNTGVGADGIAVIEKSNGDNADYFCEIVNPDGSIAGFSGNGTRCAVAYLHYKTLWSDERLRLATRSGVKTYDLLERKADNEFWFDAEIGEPRFSSDEIPALTPVSRHTVVDEPIEVGGRLYEFAAVNVGNPVACIFVDDFSFDWRALGCEMETHEMFPQRANIVFVKVIDRENIEIRIWERGAGETAASGTCSSGAAVLSAFLQKTGRTMNVHSEGGMTKVVWRDDDKIVITGSAMLAFCGEWPE
ncbi:MAG: diaminopimelate epimerase [Pyrinomonadaceae bacterium]